MANVDAELVRWRDDYSVGVAEIDAQHRILVDTLNTAATNLHDDSSLELFEQITRDLLSYALYHFETEEEIMQKYDYAMERPQEFERHLHEHRSFSETVVGVRDNLKLGKRVSRDDLLSFLSNWLLNHILHTDKLLGEFVIAKQGKQA